MGKILHPGYFPPATKYPASVCYSPALGDPELADLMAAYWRIRRWKVSVTYFTGCGNSPPSQSFDFFFDSEAATEEELVCGNRLKRDTSNPTIGGDGEALLDVRLLPCSPVFRLWITGTVDCYFFVGSNTVGNHPVCLDPSAYDTPSYQEVTLYGTVKIPFYSVASSFYGSGANIDFIGPVLWWSYGGTYDTLTGAPL